MMTAQEIISEFEDLKINAELFIDEGDQFLGDNIDCRSRGDDDKEYFADIFGKEFVAPSYEEVCERIFDFIRGRFGNFSVIIRREDESCYLVVHFTDHDVYLKITGWYSSYNGYNFSDGEFQECRPKEKTIIIYEYV